MRFISRQLTKTVVHFTKSIRTSPPETPVSTKNSTCRPQKKKSSRKTRYPRPSSPRPVGEDDHDRLEQVVPELEELIRLAVLGAREVAEHRLELLLRLSGGEK